MITFKNLLRESSFPGVALAEEMLRPASLDGVSVKFPPYLKGDSLMRSDMELDDSIRADRATRDFADRPVPTETVELLVDHARQAGSGHNRQPWTFIALRERENIDTLATFGDYTTPLERAPIGIVIAVDESDTRHRHEHNVFDCGRAGQNLMLVATANGLGTVPQGLSEREKAGEFLKLPSNKRVLLGFAVGYPASNPKEDIEGVDKEEELNHLGRKPVEDLLHWEKYS